MVKSRFLYLATNGQIFGPFAAARVLAMYKSGKLKADDMISTDKNRWVSAQEFFEPERSVPVKAASASSAEKKSEDKPVLIPVDSDAQKYSVRLSTPGKTAGVFAMIFSLAALFTVMLCLCFEPAPADETDLSNGTARSGYAESEDYSGEPYDPGVPDFSGNGPDEFSGELPSPPEEEAAPATPQVPANSGKMQDIIRKNKYAVGVIIIQTADNSGRISVIPAGTAWACDERSFVTNAHVMESVKKHCKNLLGDPRVKKFAVAIALNESSEVCIVEGVKIHPEYTQSPESNDFAVLFVRDPVRHILSCAGKEELYALQQGDEIFYLGFPMEGLKNGNINVNSPTATMQDGRISSISDTTFGNGRVEDNILIRHNLPTAGGASGSPVFSVSGKVIAIVKGGNMDLKFDENGRYLGREPSAAQINFAIRIDRLEACHKINFTHIDDFLGR